MNIKFVLLRSVFLTLLVQVTGSPLLNKSFAIDQIEQNGQSTNEVVEDSTNADRAPSSAANREANSPKLSDKSNPRKLSRQERGTHLVKGICKVATGCLGAAIGGTTGAVTGAAVGAVVTGGKTAAAMFRNETKNYKTNPGGAALAPITSSIGGAIGAVGGAVGGAGTGTAVGIRPFAGTIRSGRRDIKEAITGVTGDRKERPQQMLSEPTAQSHRPTDNQDRAVRFSDSKDVREYHPNDNSQAIVGKPTLETRSRNLFRSKDEDQDARLDREKRKRNQNAKQRSKAVNESIKESEEKGITDPERMKDLYRGEIPEQNKSDYKDRKQYIEDVKRKWDKGKGKE
ncbi:MAG: glycine zipper family protein [Bdellovibrionia bacterium]